jgi:hypothetical protein
MACCERCEITVGDEFNDANPNEARLQEMHFNFGILTLLCYDCRKAWSKFNYNHPLFKEYSVSAFRLKLWQLKYRKAPTKTDVEEGIALLQKLEGIEPQLYTVTTNWIKAGIDRKERESRKSCSGQGPAEDSD